MRDEDDRYGDDREAGGDERDDQYDEDSSQDAGQQPYPGQGRDEGPIEPSGVSAPAPQEGPDVLLDVPQLHVDEIGLEVDDLRARVSLQAEVLDLLKLNVGADVALGRVHLDVKGVDAQALLKVRLDNVAQVIGRVLTTIDRNPRILEQLTEGVAAATSELGAGARHAVGELGRGAGSATEEIGRGAGSAVEDVGEQAGELAQGVAGETAETVRELADEAGDAAEEAVEYTGEAVDGAGRKVRNTADDATREARGDGDTRRSGTGETATRTARRTGSPPRRRTAPSDERPRPRPRQRRERGESG